MIDKLTYDQVITMSKDLQAQADIISKLGEAKELQDLKDFAATIEGYSKFLDTTVKMNKDADKALSFLTSQKKGH